MKLILTDDEGTVIEQWDVEEDFGNLRKPLAKQAMANDIADAVIRATPESTA